MNQLALILLAATSIAWSAGHAAEQSLSLTEKASISVYSDRDERKNSSTQIKADLADGVLSGHYRLDRGSNLDSVYAGMSIQLANPLADDVRSLSFQIKVDAKAVQPATIGLHGPGGKRSRLELNKYGTVEREWQTFAIALDDFRLSHDDRRQLTSLSFTLIHLDKGNGVATLDATVSIRNVVFSTKPVPPRSVLPDLGFLDAKKVKEFKPGHAAWIYQESDEDVARIIDYNKRQPGMPIRILMVYAGSLSMKETEGTLTRLKIERLKWFRDRLPPEIEIHANLDSDGGRRLASFPPEEQLRLGKLVAEQINQVPSIHGLHLDIEPYSGDALPFYVHLKKHLKKPLGAALFDWDPILLRVLDYPVLMAYDLARTPEQFEKKAAAKYLAFAQDAQTAESFYFLGVPFAATTVEHEYSEHRTNGKREVSGFKMGDFVSASLKAFKQTGKIAADPYFGGIAVWGFIDKDKKGVGGPRSEIGYYPHRIADTSWKLLEDFRK